MIPPSSTLFPDLPFRDLLEQSLVTHAVVLDTVLNKLENILKELCYGLALLSEITEMKWNQFDVLTRLDWMCKMEIMICQILVTPHTKFVILLRNFFVLAQSHSSFSNLFSRVKINADLAVFKSISRIYVLFLLEKFEDTQECVDFLSAVHSVRVDLVGSWKNHFVHDLKSVKMKKNARKRCLELDPELKQIALSRSLVQEFFEHHRKGGNILAAYREKVCEQSRSNDLFFVLFYLSCHVISNRCSIHYFFALIQENFSFIFLLLIVK